MGKSTPRSSNLKPCNNGELIFGRGAGDPGEADAASDPGATTFPSEANGGPSPEKPADALADFTPAEPPAAAGVPDPEAELDAYKSAAQVEVADRRPARVSALQIRKPNDQEYVRVMPGG